MKPPARPSCKHRLRFLAVALLICQATIGLAQEKSSTTDEPPLGRFLLVASDGLYIMEPNGGCSWSYNPEPYKGQGWVEYDDLVYDGCALPNDRFLFATHRYVREVDLDGRTIWEYRVKGTAEVKACVPLPSGGVAIEDSEEQAILELERGTGKVLHRVSVPANGNNHTRYNSMRLTPEGNYLIALRAEERFLEITRGGKTIRSFSVNGLPCCAERLKDGETVCTGGFGVARFDTIGEKVWSFTREDAAPHFPMIYAGGIHEFADGRLLICNADWHYSEKNQNRVQAFVIDAQKNITWTLPATAFGTWKKSEIEPITGFVEHRVCLIQPLPKSPR